MKVESAYEFATGTQAIIRRQVEGRLTGAWVGGAGAIVRPMPRIALGASFGFGGTSRLIQESRVIEGGAFDQSWQGRQELPTEWAAGLQVQGAPADRPQRGLQADPLGKRGIALLRRRVLLPSVR